VSGERDFEPGVARALGDTSPGAASQRVGQDEQEGDDADAPQAPHAASPHRASRIGSILAEGPRPKAR